MADPLRTVAGPGEAAFEVRGSAFLGRVAPAEDVEAAEALLEAAREDHPDATHHVSAYRLREGDLLRAWSSDDGEPSGSAGTPALNVLERRDLEDVAAVVVRRFGGTELGVGGLARAYGRAVSLAVEDAGVIEREPTRRVSIEVEYDDSGTARGVLESAGVAFEADYAESVVFEARLPAGEADALLDRLRSATRGRAAIEPGD